MEKDGERKKLVENGVGMRAEMKLNEEKKEDGEKKEEVDKRKRKDVVVVGGSIIDFVIRAEGKKRLMVSKSSQFIHFPFVKKECETRITIFSLSLPFKGYSFNFLTSRLVVVCVVKFKK